MTHGVMWRAKRGQWNAACYPAIMFDVHVVRDFEWDSEYDSSRFEVAVFNVDEKEARDFLEANGAATIETVLDASPKRSGLDILAREFQRK